MTTGHPGPPRTPPPRSRARTLIPLGLALWVVLEIWLLIFVAGVSGGLTILALLVGGAVIGAVVIKSAGRRAFANLTATLQRQQQAQQAAGPEAVAPPEGHGSTGNGFLMLGGLLIMIPGLITDVLGLLLLVPFVRKALGRYAERSLERRMSAVAAPGSLGDAFQQARMRQPDGKVVQGEVIRHDEPPRPPEDNGPRPPLSK
ncbi:FxsA family membrane protein [Streptomyces sp. SID3212]|uniref:FxsA family membrane protein n=1 Tax=Streptomyces sp. SID3212 TaxID=2690259 RepID=UPI001367CF38|nr:FxsA family membrane protein [Streptomyces sp. SID3212]MYV51584.1 FxsA family protein [Streptomyces sp. SID3212]